MDIANSNFENVKDYLKTMENVRSLLHSTLDFDELMNRLIFVASKAINCETAAISFKEGDHWVVRYSYGFNDSVIGSIMNDDEERHAVLAITKRLPIIINNTLTDDRVNKEHLKEWNIKSVIVVPLLNKEKVIGTVFFNFHNESQIFNELTIEFIQSLSHSISMALQNVIEFQSHQKALDKYKSLFNSIDEGFCIIDMIFDTTGKPVDYRYVETNPAFESQTGLHSVEGKLVSEVNPNIENYWLDLFVKATFEGRQIAYTNDATPRWFSVFAFKIDSESDNTIGVLFKDITADIKLQKRLEKNLKLQEEIFVNISHELKTPLSVIFSTVQLLEYYLKYDNLEIIKEKATKNIKIIKQNCFRFTKLINNIVDISKMDAGYLKLNLRNENIVKVISDIVQSVSEFIKSKELSIDFQSNIDEKLIACDAEKIERIMLNLISNAIKFSDKGSKIYINISDKGDFVEISVRDTGVGMDEKHLKSIFNRFHQVDRTLSRNAEGSGIGLSIVKSIIDLHGGNLSAESQIGKGSTIKFDLPSKLVEFIEHSEHVWINNNKVDMINIEFSDIYRL